MQAFIEHFHRFLKHITNIYIINSTAINLFLLFTQFTDKYSLAFSFCFFEVPGRKLTAIRKKSNVSLYLLFWTGNLRQEDQESDSMY